VGETVTLTPVRDNSLIEDAEGARSSGSGPYLFVGRNNGGNLRRAVIAFDVAAALPAGSVIHAATLRVHVGNVSTTARRTVTVHRMLASWGEGASSATGGSGSPSLPGDATWLHRFYPDSLWEAPGGDFLESASAGFEIGDVGAYTVDGEGLTADVRLWLDRPELASGWLLRGDETENGSAKRLDSREIDTLDDAPRLTLDYTPPDTPTLPLTWGGLKSWPWFAAPR
jgi:hypothetical protein